LERDRPNISRPHNSCGTWTSRGIRKRGFSLSAVFVGNGEDEALRMVATNGHRLATIDRRLPNARIERPARYLRVNLKGPPGAPYGRRGESHSPSLFTWCNTGPRARDWSPNARFVNPAAPRVHRYTNDHG